MRIKLPFILLLSGILLGCQSENTTDPAPKPEPAVKTFAFDFSYDPQQTDIKEYELVMSQKDGKVLLDTLVGVKVNHTLKVKTDNTKFNITTIAINPTTKRSLIRTYFQVNPDKWKLVNNPNITTPQETSSAKIYYSNITYDRGFIFQTLKSKTSGSQWSGNSAVVNYERLIPNDLAYMMVPSSGKYMFTEITSSQTNVDFSKANATTKHKYSKPVGVGTLYTALIGYPKAGDYSNPMMLYRSASNLSEEYDLQYPSTIIKEFDLLVSYGDDQGYEYNYNYIGTTIPTQIDFVVKSDFQIIKSDFNDFQVSFSEDKPTSYAVNWVSADIDLHTNWHIFLSPEETSFNPKEFLENLKTKSYSGKSLQAFKLSSVQTNKVKDATYQEYLNYRANPEATLNKELKQYRFIFKQF